MSLLNDLKGAKKVLIVGHVRPDGDSFGAGFAIKKILVRLGAQVDFCIDSILPAHYAFLPGFNEINSRFSSDYDLAVAVDCADEHRLGKYYDAFKKAKRSVNIDHHVTNTNFGTINYVQDVSSTCELIYYLLKGEYEFDSEIAYFLFVGLSTDTAHFRHSNTTSATLDMARNLVSYDFDRPKLINDLYNSNTKGKVKLIAKALNSFRFFCDDRIVIITITKQMLDDCGCDISDTEGIIDYGMSIDTVDVAICMTQQAQNSYKVSFRSKNANVAESAQVFGGGGHVHASGCVVNGFYEDCIDKLVKSVTDGMNL